MYDSDRDEFAEKVKMLFSIYKQPISTLLLDAWWGALGGYPLHEITWAMNLHATDVKRGMYPPTVADIVLHLTETLPKLNRDEVASKRRELLDRLDPLHREGFMLVNDWKLDLKTAEEVSPRLKELAQLARDIQDEAQYAICGVAQKRVGYRP